MSNYAGVDEQGAPLFDVVIRIPDAVHTSRAPTSAQLASISRRYMGAVDQIETEQQAHFLLCCSEYAKAMVERVFLRTKRPIKNLLSVAVAGHITQHGDLSSAAEAWSENYFAKMIEDPDPEDSVIYAEIFDLCMLFYELMINDRVEGVRLAD